MTPFEPPTYVGQKRRHSSSPEPLPTSNLVPISSVENDHLQQEDEVNYDTLMTPFFPPSYSDEKRIHSPSPSSSPPSSTMITSRGRTVQRHNYKRLNSGRAVKIHSAYTNPKSWTEAMTRSDADVWKEAVKSEMQSLISTGTAIIVDRKEVPRDRSMLTGKWVFKRKTNADGSLDKYRAR